MFDSLDLIELIKDAILQKIYYLTYILKKLFNFNKLFTMNYKLLFSILFFSTFSFGLFAQSQRSTARWNEAISALKQTSFIKQYENDKDLMEGHIAELMSKKAQVSASDMEAIKRGYNETVDAYDGVLAELKTRFTNRQGRAAMQSSPQEFTTDLERKIKEANSIYNNKCLKIIDAAIHQHDGAFGLMEVTFLISVAKELYAMYEKRQAMLDAAAGDYFDRNFVKGLRLKKWDAY